MEDSTEEKSQISESDLCEESARIVELADELRVSVSALVSTTSDEEQSLRQRALALQSKIQKLRSSIDSVLEKGSLDPKETENLDENLYRVRCIMNDSDVSLLLPCKPHGSFLKMFLGPVDVRAKRKDIQLKIKEEYYSYRDKTAFQFLLFPSALLVLRSWIWNGCFPVLPVQLYQAWLLFLYTSLALRENILRVNGSGICPWWIWHHYCAMLMALVCLTWEIKGKSDCAHKQNGLHLFFAWAMMQGVAMLLQNRYQRQRLYTRIALGKAGRMDVVWGETAGVKGQLWLLCPILFILQGFEGYIGLLLLKTALGGGVFEWQVLVCGILLIVMAVGNFANTVEALLEKSRVKARMRIKGKQQFDQVLPRSSIQLHEESHELGK